MTTMNQKSEDSKWWRNLARYLLVLTIGAAFFCFLNILIMQSSVFASFIMDFISFGSRDPLGKAIDFVAVLAILFGVLSVLFLLSAIGIFIGCFLGYTIKTHVIVLIISFMSIVSLYVFR